MMLLLLDFLLIVLKSDLELMLIVIALPLQLLLELEAVLVQRLLLIGMKTFLEHALVSKLTLDG